MTLDEFRKKNKKKSISKLIKYKTEISVLYLDGYSHESISLFLNSNGVKTSRRNVSKFIRNLDKKNKIKIEEPKKDTPIIEEKKSISLNEMKQLKEENTQEPTQKKSLLKTSNVKKFEIIEPDYSQFIH